MLAGMTRTTKTQAPLRFALLVRLSDKLRDDPLDRQKADALDVLDELGGVIVGDVLEERVSGSRFRQRNVQREGWDRIVQLAKDGQIDGVIVYSMDRLTREPRAMEDLISLGLDGHVQRGGLLVASPGEERAQVIDLATGDGMATARGRVTQAASESDAISRRTKRANAAKRGQRPFWSFRPFGFQLNGEHHPAEAQIVRDVYARFVDGASLGAIAAWLNGKAITQPERKDKATGDTIAKPWTGNAVRLLLQADRNVGVLRSSPRKGRKGYDTQPGGWEAIVDHDTFQAARRLLGTNAARQVTGNKRSHLLSGLLDCGVCGRRLTSMPGQSGFKYVCRRDVRAGREGCGLGVSAARVEEVVRDEVIRLLSDEGVREAMAVPNDSDASAVQLHAAIQTAKDRVADLLARTRGADATYTLDDVEPEVKLAKAQAAQAQAQLDRVDASSPTKNLPTDPDELREGWDAWTLAQRQATIADVLDSIAVRKATGRGCVFDRSRVVCVPRFPAAADVAA